MDNGTFMETTITTPIIPLRILEQVSQNNYYDFSASAKKAILFMLSGTIIHIPVKKDSRFQAYNLKIYFLLSSYRNRR